MKDIDISKAREAILLLQSGGKPHYAQVMWDLLDHYISQKPQPSEAQAGNGLEEPVPTPVPPCELSGGHASACARKASGRVGSVHLCYPHGQHLAIQAKVPFVLYKYAVPEGDLSCEIHTATGGAPCTFRPIGYLRRIGQADLHLCNFHSKHPVAMKSQFTLYAV